MSTPGGKDAKQANAQRKKRIAIPNLLPIVLVQSCEHPPLSTTDSSPPENAVIKTLLCPFESKNIFHS